MNSTKALSDERRYSAKPFFKFTLNQNVHQFALYIIIVLLVMILPCFIRLGEGDYRNYSADRLENYAMNTMQAVAVIGIFVSAAIAMFAGMSAMSYVNSKQAVGCYHSLPIRREWIFLSETAIRAIYYIISIAIGYTVSYFMIIGILPVAAEFTGFYITLALTAVLCFMYVYSIVLLAGGLTGTSFMRFVMTFVITFLPFALYALIVFTFDMGALRLYDSYYFDYDRLRYVFPFIRVFVGIEKVFEDKTAVQLLTVIPESIVYYIGAMFLHKYRKSELSGTTVVWKPVFAIVKYLLIFTASLLGMVLFGGIFYGNSESSIIFGTIFGLVISFMLVNSIMYRSSRSMFSGLKPFIAVSAITVIYMIFVPLNVTGMIGEPYSASNTRSLTININGQTIEYTDREIIDELVPFIKDSEYLHTATVPSFMGISKEKSGDDVEALFGEYMYFDDDAKYHEERFEEKYVDYTSYVRSLNVIQKPIFGITLARYYEVDTNGEFWDALFKTQEFLEAFNLSKILDGDWELREFEIDYHGMDITVNEASYLINNMSYHNNLKYFDINELVSKCKLKSEYRDNSSIVGTLRIFYEMDEKRNTITYPIYADDFEVVKLTNEIVNLFSYEYNGEYAAPFEMKNIDDYYESVAEMYDAAVIVDILSGEAKLLSKKDICTLAPYTTMFGCGDKIYEIWDYAKVSDSRYVIFSEYLDEQINYRLSREIRFRDGALSDDELKKIFDSIG